MDKSNCERSSATMRIMFGLRGDSISGAAPSLTSWLAQPEAKRMQKIAAIVFLILMKHPSFDHPLDII